MTNRQVELIGDLLATYDAYRKDFNERYGKHDTKVFIFNDLEYIVLGVDYTNICEIIDYIKGVK